MPFGRAWFGWGGGWGRALGRGWGRGLGRRWFGWGNPYAWGWPGYSMPYGYRYGGYGYLPWGGMPKEEEKRMLEEQEKWLTSELDGVRKRLEELSK